MYKKERKIEIQQQKSMLIISIHVDITAAGVQHFTTVTVFFIYT